MKTRARRWAARGLLAGSLVIAALASTSGIPTVTSTVRAQDSNKENELAQLRAEVAKLRSGQSLASAMRDIDYHAQNLFFAGRASNWPLANYYWQNTLTHMRLAADLPAPAGKQPAVDFKAIQQSIENSPSMQVGQAIDRKDVVLFQNRYRSLLEGCYACHKAADKPFLRPRMPVKPHQAMINVDPTATWPK
jgi:hypothetical protein